MKSYLMAALLLAGILTSCADKNKSEEKKQAPSTAPDTVSREKTEKPVMGQHLFEEILDTVTVKPLTVEMLINSSWRFFPSPETSECTSTLTFLDDKTGKEFDCEIRKVFDFNYALKGDTLVYEAFDSPEMDYEESEKFKISDQKYVYNGHSLFLVGATMYNEAGKQWTPEINKVIEYKQGATE